MKLTNTTYKIPLIDTKQVRRFTTKIKSTHEPVTTVRIYKPKTKTRGLEWLLLSFASFNGSGYANTDTPEEFVESYINYNGWKRRQEAVELAREHYDILFEEADRLINTSQGASREPNEKQARKFQAYLETINKA